MEHMRGRLGQFVWPEIFSRTLVNNPNDVSEMITPLKIENRRIEGFEN